MKDLGVADMILEHKIIKTPEVNAILNFTIVKVYSKDSDIMNVPAHTPFDANSRLKQKIQEKVWLNMNIPKQLVVLKKLMHNQSVDMKCRKKQLVKKRKRRQSTAVLKITYMCKELNFSNKAWVLLDKKSTYLSPEIA